MQKYTIIQILCIICLLPSFIDAQKAYCTYHMYFANTSLTTCSCSDGKNGLMTNFNYQDLSQMFPYVAAYNNAPWNSPNCGKCMKITYKGKTIYVTAIDQCGPPIAGADVHFDISPEAFKEVFGDEGISKGSIIADYQEYDPCLCKGNKFCNKSPKPEPPKPEPPKPDQKPTNPTNPTNPIPPPKPDTGSKDGQAIFNFYNYEKNLDLNKCACSDGKNGLVTQWGYKNISEMYPYVGAYNKAQWNSPNCGKCMKMSYKSKVIYITVIDFSGVASSDADKAAFKLSSDAFKELFGKDSLAVGQYQGNFVESDPCNCKGNKFCKQKKN